MNEFPWNYVWVAVNVALIFFLARRFLGKAAGQFLGNRRQEIVDRFGQAEEAVASATRMREDATRRLDELEGERRALMARARDRMKVLSEEARRTSEEEAARILERARTGVMRERDLAVKALWVRASHRTVDATRVVLARVSGPGDDRKLVGDLLRGLKEVDV